MKLNIAVYGSAREDSMAPPVLEWAARLGERIARTGHVLLTGGTAGVPGRCSEGCLRAGGLRLAIRPDACGEAVRDPQGLTVYSNMGVTGRSMLLANTADLAIAVMGGSGTLLEIIMSYLQRKTILIVAGEQRADDPDITALLARRTEIEVRGVRLERGWLDSKSESGMRPVHVVRGLVDPQLLVEIGLELYARNERTER